MLELILTEDGSHTLYNPELHEHYHSTHGAVQEGQHVFIAAGFAQRNLTQTSIRILEVGFGTGLNALLTLAEARKSGISVQYHALEPFPLPSGVISTLNYPELSGLPAYRSDFERFHSQEEGMIALGNGFNLFRYKQGVHDFIADGLFDLVYFDAFAPDVQPEMWTEAVFQKIASCMKAGGILVTYCAKGQVKRNMKAAGLVIERLPGPPGKREMTRGKRI